MASYFSKFGARGLGQLGPALRGAGETETPVRHSGQLSPRALLAHPCWWRVHPQQGLLPRPRQLPRKGPETPALWGAAGSSGAPRGAGRDAAVRPPPTWPTDMRRLLSGLCKVPEHSSSPNPRDGPGTQREAHELGGAQGQLRDPAPSGKAGRGGGGALTPPFLSLETGPGEGGAETVWPADRRGGARGTRSFKQGTCVSPPGVRAPCRLPQRGPTSELGTHCSTPARAQLPRAAAQRGVGSSGDVGASRLGAQCQARF